MLYNLYELANEHKEINITNYFTSNVKNIITENKNCDSHIIIEFNNGTNLVIKTMLGGYCMDIAKATTEKNIISDTPITKAIIKFDGLDDNTEQTETEMFLKLYSGMELVCSIHVYICIDADTDMFVLAIDDGAEDYKNLYEVCWG